MVGAVVLVFSIGCSSASEEAGCGEGAIACAKGPAAPEAGRSFGNAADAPGYDGASFASMRIFDLGRGEYLDEEKLMTRLDDERLVFFGEQHETAPVQELELWLLQRMTARHGDVALAMEHFQRDEQRVVDDYLAGRISETDFVRRSSPWKGYATYWRPLVEHMKAISGRLLALNVPDEALDVLYGAFPKAPLAVFNSWNANSAFDASIPPRPLRRWDESYQAYFESSFDYGEHAQKMGLSRAEGLAYFTDLAHIRDETMSHFIAQELLSGSGRVLVVAGDWHVRTGLATPDRVVQRMVAATNEPWGAYTLVTTSTREAFDATRAERVHGREVARFVLVYDEAAR
jgi:uncharacterized iron-regulated protein